MPFDERRTTRINDKLAELRDLLRKEDQFPEGFKWNYSYLLNRSFYIDHLEAKSRIGGTPKCGTVGCAIGLAILHWPHVTPHGYDGDGDFFATNDTMREWARFLGIDYKVFESIFLAGCIDIDTGVCRPEIYLERQQLGFRNGYPYQRSIGASDVADAIDYYDQHGDLVGFE